MADPISSRHYGIMPTGQPIEAWTLTGRGRLLAEVITLGGIVTRLLAPDRHGDSGDVVLGLSDLESYLAGHPYLGAIVGRVAGRITGAAFTLEDRTYLLACNEPPNHLHGGVSGFDKRIWSAAPRMRRDGAPSLRLAYRSPDGEEGYPGNVDVAVTYTVTNEDTLLIETEAMSDQTTPLSLTHHSYFNLAGEGRCPIHDHMVAIFADEVIPAGEHLTLTGRMEPVGPSNDFRLPRRIGDAVPHLFQQHGDLYVLPKKASAGLNPVARVEDPASGRVMTVSTTNPYLQLYSGRYLDGSCIGKSGAAYGPFAGLCLECEGYADAANTELRNDILLHPGETQRQTTTYAFSVMTGETGSPPRASR